MKRNSTTLFLESPGAVTPVPWVNGAPDFSGFTEPTLGVLQKAWDERESEPEIIPDPEPIVEPVPPDWQGFINRLDLPYEGNPTGTGLFAVLLGIDATSAWQSYNMCLNFLRGFGGVLELRTLGFIYSALSQALTSEQQTQLENAIADFDIPIQI